MFDKMKDLIRRIVIRLIKAYQKQISPLLPVSCRFYPSCSQYALDAVERYGSVKGVFLAILRILKCHPFHPGGYDPVK